MYDEKAGRAEVNFTRDCFGTGTGYMARPIEFKIGIPANFKTDGYDYALIFVQSDGTTSVIVDTDDDSDTMTFSTDVYGTFTLVKGPSGSFAAYR